MGFRESRPGFKARGYYLLSSPRFFVRLEKSVSSPRPTLANGRRAQGSVKDAHLRAREGFVLDGPEHTGRLRTRRGVQRISGSASLSVSGKRTAEPYIRSARSRAETHIPHAGKEEAGLDGTNLLAGIEAMNGPGHTSIPVRRTQGLQRAHASDKLVTPP